MFCLVLFESSNVLTHYSSIIIRIVLISFIFSHSCQKFEEFVRTTVKTGELAEKYESIVKTEAENSGDAMDTN